MTKQQELYRGKIVDAEYPRKAPVTPSVEVSTTPLQLNATEMSPTKKSTFSFRLASVKFVTPSLIKSECSQKMSKGLRCVFLLL